MDFPSRFVLGAVKFLPKSTRIDWVGLNEKTKISKRNSACVFVPFLGWWVKKWPFWKGYISDQPNVWDKVWSPWITWTLWFFFRKWWFKNHQLPGDSIGDLFGMVKWPFKGLSDLQLGNQKVTLNHLVLVVTFTVGIWMCFFGGRPWGVWLMSWRSSTYPL